jgi:hypothetical protein
MIPASTSQNDEGDLAPARKKGAEMRQKQGPLACTDRSDAVLRDGVCPVAPRAEMHPQRDRHCTGTQTRHHAAARRTRLCAANAIFLLDRSRDCHDDAAVCRRMHACMPCFVHNYAGAEEGGAGGEGGASGTGMGTKCCDSAGLASHRRRGLADRGVVGSIATGLPPASAVHVPTITHTHTQVGKALSDRGHPLDAFAAGYVRSRRMSAALPRTSASGVHL